MTIEAQLDTLIEAQNKTNEILGEILIRSVSPNEPVTITYDVKQDILTTPEAEEHKAATKKAVKKKKKKAAAKKVEEPEVEEPKAEVDEFGMPVTEGEEAPEEVGVTKEDVTGLLRIAIKNGQGTDARTIFDESKCRVLSCAGENDLSSPTSFLNSGSVRNLA